MADVERLVAASFGAHERVLDAGPLSGGGFAAVWWITLSDRRTVVLKASPPAHVPLLAYEQGLLSAEARYYRLVGLHAPQVPVPQESCVTAPTRSCSTATGCSRRCSTGER